MIPPDLLALVDALGNPSQCGPSLTDRLRKVFSPVLCPAPVAASARPTKPPAAKRKIEPLDLSLVGALGPLAMRLVNQNVKLLGEVAPKNIDTKRTPSEGSQGIWTTAAISCLTETSEIALKSLIAMEKGLSLKEWDIERAYSNTITKMVEARQYEQALRLLASLRQRLLECPSNPRPPRPSSQKSGLAQKTQLKDSGKQPLGKAKGAINVTNTAVRAPASRVQAPKVKLPLEKESITDSEVDWTFPINGDPLNPTTRTNIIIAAQTNLLKCWIEQSLFTVAIEYLESQHSILEWIRFQRVSEEKAAAKNAGMVSRLLFKGATQLHHLSPSDALRLRGFSLSLYVQSDSFSIPAFHDQVAKIGSSFETSMITQSYDKILAALSSFYDTCWNSIEPFISTATLDLQFLNWCEHYHYLCRKFMKAGTFTRISHPNRYLSVVSGFLKDRDAKSSDAACCELIAALNLVAGRLDLSMIDTTEDIVTDLTVANDRMRELLANASTSRTNELIFHVMRSIDTLRNACKTILEGNDDHSADFRPDLKPTTVTTKITLPDKRAKITKMSRAKPRTQKLSDPEPTSVTAISHTSKSRKKIVGLVQNLFSTSIDLFRAEFSTNMPRKCAVFVVNTCLWLSRSIVASSALDDSQLQQALSSLEYAKQIGANIEDKSVELWRMISNGYFLLGGELYKQGRHKEAFPAVLSAVQSMVHAIHIADPSSVMASDLSSQFIKRFDILSECSISISQQEAILKEFRLTMSTVATRMLLVATSQNPGDQRISSPNIANPIKELLIRYTRLMCSMPLGASKYEPFANSLQSSPSHVRIAALESELAILCTLTTKVAAKDGIAVIVSGLLDIYRDRNPLDFARILMERFKLNNLCHTSNDVGSLQDLNDCIEILKELPDNTYPVQHDLLAMAYSYLGQYSADGDSSSDRNFKIALKLWSRLLHGVSLTRSGSKISLPIDAVQAGFHDIDRTYEHIRSLADYFGAMDQHVHRLKALKLLLRFLTVRRYVEGASSDVLDIWTELGYTYLSLGHTGQAGLALHSGKALVDSKSVSEDSVLRWYVGFGYYLCQIGDMDKSTAMFDRAREYAEVSGYLSAPQRSGQADFRNTRLATAARAFFTHASVSFAQGSLPQALSEAATCLKLLIKSASAANKPSALESGFSTASAESDAPGPAQERNQTIGALLRTSRWNILKDLLECFESLGQLYLIRGSAAEAEHYFKQGAELALGLQSKLYSTKFHLYIAEIELRRMRLAEAQEKIEEATSFHNLAASDGFDKTHAILKTRLGDLSFRNERYDQAVDYYEEAIDMVDQLTDAKFFSHIETSGLRDVVVTPREKKLFIPTPRKSIDSSPSSAALKQVSLDAFLLSYFKAELLARKGMSFTKRGELDTAEKVLEGSSGNEQALRDQADYLITLSKVKILKACTAIASQPMMNGFMEATQLIPLPTWSKTSTANPKKPAKLKKNIVPSKSKVLLDEAVALLQEALEMCFSYGFPQLYRDTCLQLAFASTIRGQTDGSLGLDGRNDSLRCSYYLSSSQGLTLRREFTCLLTENAKGSYLSPLQSLAWPNNGETSNTESSLSPWASALSSLYTKESSMTPELFQRGFIEKLPENLVVCSLSLDSERDDLYLTRMTKDSNPVMVKLPLGRYGNRESAEEGFEYGSRNIFCTFSDLMARSKASIKKAGSCSTKQDKMRWWEERATLDKQLETLLFQIESTGLGGFKCLLLPSSPKSETEISEFRKSLGSALYRATSPKSSNISSMEINRELCVALMELGSNPSDSDVEDIMFYFLDSLHYGGNPIDYGEIDADMLSAEIHLAFEKIHSPPPPIDASTVLLIDKQLQQLPWESLPVLRGRPVTRLPTLSFLRDRLELAPSWRENQSRMGVYTVNQTRISYVLNPDGDLVGTERNFRDLLSCQSNWQGLVGERPTESDMKDFLCNKDVFIYFGHNGGEQYIRGQKVRRLERSAVALLMGCSSGYLQDGGEFDPTGTALNFLMAGSPALVANLWDVTDKDIDRFSVNLLQEWGLLRSSSDLSGAECQESKSLAQCVTSSREKCTFKFLNGAAPVVYGVPWVFVR